MNNNIDVLKNEVTSNESKLIDMVVNTITKELSKSGKYSTETVKKLNNFLIVMDELNIKRLLVQLKDNKNIEELVNITSYHKNTDKLSDYEKVTRINELRLRILSFCKKTLAVLNNDTIEF